MTPFATADALLDYACTREGGRAFVKLPNGANLEVLVGGREGQGPISPVWSIVYPSGKIEFTNAATAADLINAANGG